MRNRNIIIRHHYYNKNIYYNNYIEILITILLRQIIAAFKSCCPGIKMSTLIPVLQNSAQTVISSTVRALFYTYQVFGFQAWYSSGTWSISSRLCSSFMRSHMSRNTSSGTFLSCLLLPRTLMETVRSFASWSPRTMM